MPNTKCTSGYESRLIHLIHHCTLTFNIDNDVATRSLTGFSKHIKSKFLSGYSLHCDIGECYAYNNT